MMTLHLTTSSAMIEIRCQAPGTDIVLQFRQCGYCENLVQLIRGDEKFCCDRHRNAYWKKDMATLPVSRPSSFLIQTTA